MTTPKPLLLGIDVGTSAVKAVLVRPEGTVQASAEEPCPPDSPRPGWLEVPPESWWRAVRAGVRKLPTNERRQARAVGLSVAFPALVLFDERDEALRPAILYADQRSTEQAAWLTQHIGTDRFTQIAGNRPAPGNCTLTSLRWVMAEEPELFGRARTFGYANSFLALKLTGRLALDEASAPLTGLYDLGKGRWSDELLSVSEVPHEILPPLVTPASAVGQLTEQAGHELGLPAGIPVAIGSGDTVTSTLGAGIGLEEPFLTSGFTDSLVSVASESERSETPPKPIPGFVTTGAAFPGQWLRIGARSATGAAVSWAARQMLGVELERFFALAAESPPGANGLLFLPHLAGERTPLWDPEARGVFTGLTLATTAADLARAVLEGVTLGVRQMLALLKKGEGRRPVRVRAAGGATRDPFWRQLRADVCGVEFLYLSMEETAAFGAALLAGVAAGLVTDPLAVARRAQESPTRQSRYGDGARSGAELVTPHPERADLYSSLARRYADLYPTLAPLIHTPPAQGGHSGRA